MLNAVLQQFIEREIIPLYAAFDKAHQEDHARSVIEQSMAIAPYNDVNHDMVYAIAAYHDLGLQEDRKTHHLVSGRIVREGMQTMRTLANNMAWTLKKMHGIPTTEAPEREPWTPMHFIR